MTFHVAVTGVDELANHQLLTDVQIDRRLYGHSAASASIRWPDTDGYPDRTAALLAGEVLNSHEAHRFGAALPGVPGDDPE